MNLQSSQLPKYVQGEVCTVSTIDINTCLAVADPDLELRGWWGGGGAVLIYLSCRPFSLQSFLLFLPKIGGGGPSPRSATVLLQQGGNVKHGINLCMHLFLPKKVIITCSFIRFLSDDNVMFTPFHICSPEVYTLQIDTDRRLYFPLSTRQLLYVLHVTIVLYL